LFNPDTAQRCDCGYDFETKTVEKAYFTQELPSQFKGYLVLLVVWNILVGIVALAAGKPVRVVMAVIWSAIVWWLYSQLVAKKNWARLWLVVLTFPAGLLIGLSREARLYCLQK
jgi:hypothetical protein